MKSLIQAVVVATVLAAPMVSFAQSNQPVTREQVRQEGKPEEMVEKIAQGKLNKFYKESTLLNQEYIKDAKKTVRQFLAEADKELKVTGFKRIALG